MCTIVSLSGGNCVCAGDLTARIGRRQQPGHFKLEITARLVRDLKRDFGDFSIVPEQERQHAIVSAVLAALNQCERNCRSAPAFVVNVIPDPARAENVFPPMVVVEDRAWLLGQQVFTILKKLKLEMR